MVGNTSMAATISTRVPRSLQAPPRGPGPQKMLIVKVAMLLAAIAPPFGNPYPTPEATLAVFMATQYLILAPRISHFAIASAPAGYQASNLEGNCPPP